MSYTPTNWVEKVTKVGPTKLNKLENGLASASNPSPLDWSIAEDTFQGGPSSGEPANLSFGDGLWRGYGGIRFERAGTSYYIYRKESGPLEGGPGQYGSINYITSTDGWATKSAETTILSEAGVDLENLSGGVTTTGRVVVFYNRWNPDTNTFLSNNIIYSDDVLATWSSPYPVPVGSETTFSPGTGDLQLLGDGRLLLSWYGNHGAQYSVYVITSDDNGATWSASTRVITSSTELYAEPAFLALGNHTILGLVRALVGSATASGAFTQVLSTDNGATWTTQGLTTFDSGANAPPYLVLLSSGRAQMVACYYVNRGAALMLRGVYALAEDVVSHGVSAWQRRHDIKAAAAGGYISASQPFGVTDRRCLGVYSVNGVLTFFIDGAAPPWANFKKYPGQELAYTEFTSSKSITSTTEAGADVVVSSGAVTFDGSPVIVEFFSPLLHTGPTALSNLNIFLFKDGATLGQLWYAEKDDSSVADAGEAGCQASRRLTPAAGSHTFDIRACRGVSNGSVIAGPGGAGNYLPGYIRITKV